MNKKDGFGKYNFGISALAAHVLHPAFILARQNLANNCPFTKFANFTPANIFHYMVVGSDRISPSLSLLHPTPRKKYELAHKTSYALVGGAPEAYSSQFMSLCTCMCVCVCHFAT